MPFDRQCLASFVCSGTVQEFVEQLDLLIDAYNAAVGDLSPVQQTLWPIKCTPILFIGCIGCLGCMEWTQETTQQANPGAWQVPQHGSQDLLVWRKPLLKCFVQSLYFKALWSFRQNFMWLKMNLQIQASWKVNATSHAAFSIRAAVSVDDVPANLGPSGGRVGLQFVCSFVKLWGISWTWRLFLIWSWSPDV